MAGNNTELSAYSGVILLNSFICSQFVVVQSVVSDSLQPHGLRHTRLPCPSPSARVCSNLMSHLVGDTIQPSLCLLSLSPPAFNLSQHRGLFQWEVFALRGQSIRTSASTPVLPMNIQSWFPLELTGLLSFQRKDTLKSLLQHHN